MGQGQFGAVYRATMRGKDGSSTSVAVKQMLETGVSDVERSQFEYEARLLAAIKHVNIVTLKAVCFQSQPSFIVLELMSMDLKSYLDDNADDLRNNVDALVVVCLQIADAMAYLERCRIVHRDLAARFAIFES